jgi:hypothetical protein
MASSFKSFLNERHALSFKDVPLLTGVLVGSFIFWSFVYFLNHLYMHKVKKGCKEFHQLKDGDKALYLSRIPAALHAFVACILAGLVIL